MWKYLGKNNEQLPRLYGDSRRFLQILINLVKNALKFTENGRIAIIAQYDFEKSELRVEVKDTGAGIAAEEMPRLFQKFGKLNRTAEQNSTGIGLGLFIVRQIVESAGGEISVTSKGVGEGCKFAFTMIMRK